MIYGADLGGAVAGQAADGIEVRYGTRRAVMKPDPPPGPSQRGDCQEGPIGRLTHDVPSGCGVRGICYLRDTRNHNELGDVYCIDTEKNLVEAKHIDIAKWAREMKILKEWETVEA